MKLRFIILSLFLSTLASCEEDEPETNCYNCTRLIQTLDKDAILILTQEDQYQLCNKTKEEVLANELENTKEESTNSGGKKEFFTSCSIIK